MCAQFPLDSGIDGTNKPSDIQSTESWYAESENSEADMNREADKWRLEAPEMERGSSTSDCWYLWFQSHTRPGSCPGGLGSCELAWYFLSNRFALLAKEDGFL